jgi:pSer/pThr/pTyr-binding forkhead associated (FHA) protein
MPALLVALRDGPNILIDKPILLIGRHPECDIQIDSRKISRRHCVIAQINDYLVVRDLDSTNGIRINGAKVTEGRLNPGDELTLGHHVFRVQAEADALRSAPPPPRAQDLDVPEPADDDLEEADDPIPLIDRSRPLPPRLQRRTKFREDSDPIS